MIIKLLELLSATRIAGVIDKIIFFSGLRKVSGESAISADFTQCTNFSKSE